MLTPQEVSTHVFQKSVMGGYNMAMVDEFLDQMTEDYTALFKENAALKAKMKVLVDKIEEYRSTEDAMRATLLTAQKMANSMIEEAKQKKEELIADAERDARRQINELQAQVVSEQQRYAAAKRETADFIATMRRVCNSELEFLDQVPELQIDVPKKDPAKIAEEKVEEKAADIEDAVKSAFPDDPFADSAKKPEDAPAPAPAPAPETKPEEKEDLEATRRISFDDLKFGRNYKKDN
jgi:cell division initiation protein